MTADFPLRAEPGRAALAGKAYPQTTVWSYNGQVPGPEIRVRQGERLKFTVENRLDEETTVHSHGLRLPNAMDGVPHLTQKPIAPGETFTYEFDVPDAGTYWYHPHTNSAEQIGRGLSGPMIVEEREPIEVDRDITWVLDDWRLLSNAAISDDFGNRMDAGMAGRLGNTVTINGQMPDSFEVRAGERIRLRLINTANARIFGLDFGAHRPRIIAYDGQPVEPHGPANGLVVLGPAMRIDLIIDMANESGQSFTVVDRFYPSQTYRLIDIVYSDKPALRARPPVFSIRLLANTMPEPDIARAKRHEVAFGGGMMGGGMMGGGMMGRMMGGGKMWTINGVAFEGPVMEPLLTLEQGRSHVLTLRNETAWYHPIHLHGHSFRVISRNGRQTPYREWQDTVLIAPRENADIAFVADNPGDWMFHCHIAEHLAAGMMGIVRVS
ncbi:MAG: multicopper oxidase family protein [Proteobacteria bacterium]|nr:multicopper oxidase family protein [Pseudomonadota bacterium]